MRALRDTAGAELELTRTYRRRAELRAGDDIVGTLERQSWWRQHVLLTAAEGQWMLRWSGWFARQAVVTTNGRAGEREIGRYRAGWRGDGTLALPDGRELQLTRPRGWRRARTLCDNGAELLTLRPHGLKGHATVTVADPARQEPLLSVFVLVVCQILISDQAAMASAGAGAVASGGAVAGS